MKRTSKNKLSREMKTISVESRNQSKLIKGYYILINWIFSTSFCCLSENDIDDTLVIKMKVQNTDDTKLSAIYSLLIIKINS